jgi:hypothetical protein
MWKDFFILLHICVSGLGKPKIPFLLCVFFSSISECNDDPSTHICVSGLDSFQQNESSAQAITTEDLNPSTNLKSTSEEIMCSNLDFFIAFLNTLEKFVNKLGSGG